MECREAQLLLFDPADPAAVNGRAQKAAAARSELAAHLALCPECRAAADAARAGEDLKSALDAAERERPVRLSNELEQRVRRLAHTSLARSRKAVAGGEIPPRLASRGGRLASIPPLRGEAPARRPLYARPLWAVAAVLALVVAGLVAQSQFGSGARAKLEFLKGSIQISEAGAQQDYANILQSQALASAASLATGTDSQCFLTLGAARVAMASNTAVEYRNSTGFRLNKGQVWLQVEHDGRGFRIETPNGVVRVTGTRFGVTVDPASNRTQVEVVEGTVVVTGPDGEGAAPVSAGQSLTVADAVGAAAPRPSGTDLPGWIESLAAERDVAASVQFLPTFMGKKP